MASEVPAPRVTARNVLGGELEPCSMSPRTGFYRDGCCNSGADDVGAHTVCVVMTEEFLDYSLSQGNDLLTPMPQYGFSGLQPGDRWCLCASRWAQALDGGAAPQVVLASTHERTLEYVGLDDLRAHAVDS
jgi:uncharacterized protein (DUF2237 family)